MPGPTGQSGALAIKRATEDGTIEQEAVLLLCTVGKSARVPQDKMKYAIHNLVQVRRITCMHACMQRFIIIRPAIISVDGYWKAWSEWSACSVTCNSGIQTSTRQCVPPLYGGKDCVGNGVQTRPCELVAKCPSKTFVYQQHKEDIFICLLSCQLTVSGLIGETGHDALSLVMEKLKHEVASSWSLLSTEAKLV